MGLDDIAAISLPTRGRTGWPSHRFCCFANSDLRTRAGDGLPVARRAFHFRHFNPHTCLGGSLLMSGPGRGCNHFGSCPPCGSETRPTLRRLPAGRISVHSLCVRSDMLQKCGIAPAFQTVLPRGDDSRADSTKRRKADFHPRIHAGAAQGGFRVRQSSRHFNPRPRAGCDGAASSLTSPRQSFKPTRPNGVRPLPTNPPSLYQFIAIHAPALGAI